MIIGIDHVIIAVEELDKAMESWQRLGFQVLKGGEHPQFGTHNALVPFSDGFYFELMAIKDPTLIDRFPVTKRLHEVLGGDNRFLGFALDSDDLGSDVDAIRERGLTIHKAPPGERVRPDGLRVAWRTAHPEDSRLPFLIQDQTPRDVRIPAPEQGLGQALSVSCIEVTSWDGQTLRDNYTRLLAGAADAAVFTLKRGAVRVSAAGLADGIETVVLKAGDPTAVARQWEAGGIASREDKSSLHGHVLIPTDTAGVRLMISV